jgi:hypothetical protein
MATMIVEFSEPGKVRVYGSIRHKAWTNAIAFYNQFIKGGWNWTSFGGAQSGNQYEAGKEWFCEVTFRPKNADDTVEDPYSINDNPNSLKTH